MLLFLFQNFQKSIFAMLATIKAREEGGSAVRKPGVSGIRPSMIPPMSGPGGPMSGVPPGVSGPAATSASGAPQQYNRYDQERFTKNDAPSGFRIDTTSSYHGLTLKSVTDGSAQPKTPNAMNGSGSNGLRSSHTGMPQKPQKRVSRTPIIMIPATPTSLITMYNARAILQDLKFIDSKNCDQRRDNEVLIQRRKPDNSTVPYRIVDDPKKLSPEDWYAQKTNLPALKLTLLILLFSGIVWWLFLFRARHGNSKTGLGMVSLLKYLPEVSTVEL